MEILQRPSAQSISTVPPSVMVAAIPVLQQLLEGPCRVTNLAVEVFLMRGKSPLARRCANDDHVLEITTRGKQWLEAACPVAPLRRRRIPAPGTKKNVGLSSRTLGS
jgi:hypothetical protein